MQMVHVHHRRQIAQRGFHLRQFNALGHGIEGDAHGLAEQVEPAPGHGQAHADPRHRIDPVPPGGTDNQGSHQHSR